MGAYAELSDRRLSMVTAAADSPHTPLAQVER